VHADTAHTPRRGCRRRASGRARQASRAAGLCSKQCKRDNKKRLALLALAASLCRCVYRHTPSSRAKRPKRPTHKTQEPWGVGAAGSPRVSGASGDGLCCMRTHPHTCKRQQHAWSTPHTRHTCGHKPSLHANGIHTSPELKLGGERAAVVTHRVMRRMRVQTSGTTGRH
jgi:hypothetical protein